MMEEISRNKAWSQAVNYSDSLSPYNFQL